MFQQMHAYRNKVWTQKKFTPHPQRQCKKKRIRANVCEPSELKLDAAAPGCGIAPHCLRRQSAALSTPWGATLPVQPLAGGLLLLLQGQCCLLLQPNCWFSILGMYSGKIWLFQPLPQFSALLRQPAWLHHSTAAAGHNLDGEHGKISFSI